MNESWRKEREYVCVNLEKGEGGGKGENRPGGLADVSIKVALLDVYRIKSTPEMLWIGCWYG